MRFRISRRTHGPVLAALALLVFLLLTPTGYEGALTYQDVYKRQARKGDETMKYAAKRIAMLLFTMVIVSLLAFAAFDRISGDPATAMLGTQATACLLYTSALRWWAIWRKCRWGLCSWGPRQAGFRWPALDGSTESGALACS